MLMVIVLPKKIGKNRCKTLFLIPPLQTNPTVPSRNENLLFWHLEHKKTGQKSTGEKIKRFIRISSL